MHLEELREMVAKRCRLALLHLTPPSSCSMCIPISFFLSTCTFASPKTEFGKTKCRKMSTEEKRKLGVALAQLSTEDISKALEIVAQNNPSFQATAEEVDLDIDAQVIIYIPFHVSAFFSFQKE